MLRYVFNSAFPWTEEVVRYSIVWLVFLGGSIAGVQTPADTFIIMELWNQVAYCYGINGSNVLYPAALRESWEPYGRPPEV